MRGRRVRGLAGPVPATALPRTGASDPMPASPPSASRARPRWRPRAFLDSVMPALDSAFGLDGEPDLPDAIADLIARLQGDPSDASAEGSAAAREAVPA